ncbi:MAG: hypothetical protein Tsb0015_01780 [Simkaniaceae bacterium]
MKNKDTSKKQCEEKKKKKAEEKLKHLREQAKNENHAYDDHGPVIIGERESAPVFPE